MWFVKQVYALPYLPRRHIRDAFEELNQRAQDSEQLRGLFEYIRATWFNSTVWAVGNWCSFKRRVRTNNDCEGWHRRLKHRAGKEKLPLYELVGLLLTEAKLVNLQLQLVREQSLSSMQRKASKDHQKRLTELWDLYQAELITTHKFLTDCKSCVPSVMWMCDIFTADLL